MTAVAEEQNYRSDLPGEAFGGSNGSPHARGAASLTKFEIYGEEMIEKRVNASGNSGRVYLPQEWIGQRVKIVRID